MIINFEDLKKTRINIEEFPLYWRFTDSKYDPPSKEALAKIIPLGKQGAGIADEILKELLFQWTKESIYKTRQNHDIEGVSGIDMQPMLSDFGVGESEMVLLSWDNSTAILTTWGVFKNHFDHFFYPSSDDITITDEKMSWVVEVDHTSHISIGIKTKQT